MKTETITTTIQTCILRLTPVQTDIRQSRILCMAAPNAAIHGESSLWRAYRRGEIDHEVWETEMDYIENIRRIRARERTAALKQTSLFVVVFGVILLIALLQ